MTNFVKETSNENLVKKDGLVPSASGLNTTIYRLPVGSSEKVAAILVDSETGNVDIRASDGTSFVKVDARNKKAFLGDTDIIAGIEGAKDIASNASSVALQDIRQNGLYLQHNKKLTTREDGQLLIDGEVFKGEKGETGPTPDIEEASDGVKIKGGNQELTVKHGDPGATGPAPSVERFDHDGRTGVAITGQNGTEHVYDGEKGENAPGVEEDVRKINNILGSHRLYSKYGNRIDVEKKDKWSKDIYHHVSNNQGRVVMLHVDISAIEGYSREWDKNTVSIRITREDNNSGTWKNVNLWNIDDSYLTATGKESFTVFDVSDAKDRTYRVQFRNVKNACYVYARFDAVVL